MKSFPPARARGMVEGPEPRSLRAVAEQGELLPERQILKCEISVGPGRRTRGAQESEYEGYCAPPSLDVIPSSSVTIEFWQTTAFRLNPPGVFSKLRVRLRS